MDWEIFPKGLELEEFSLDVVSLCQSPNYLLGNNVNFNEICMICSTMITEQYKILLNTKLIL